MTERIAKLTELVLKGETYAYPNKTEYDREDLLLSYQQMQSKRICEYILNQEPVLTPYQTMTGFFNCDSSIVGDGFRRMGHKYFDEIKEDFYEKPIGNLAIFEWQHATADYETVLNKGILGIIDEIDLSLKTHDLEEDIEFLNAIKSISYALIGWANKCSDRALELSKKVDDVNYKNNLVKLSKTLKKVPANKPTSFYEAVLTIYVCFSADPDSIGTLDRYLYNFYDNDIKNGVITREEAKEYLQELFLMLQSATHISNPYFTRGGESHFSIGGYLPNGEDGYTDLSKLILESILDLPTYIPEVTVRWTKKMSKEDFCFAMDCERKDPHKRIAFQNDEKRIKCYTEICGFPYEVAVSYTTVGCNEPTFVGTASGSCTKLNMTHSLETVFYKRTDEIVKAKDFDEFYKIFLQELFADITKTYDYDDKFNLAKARDLSYLSSIFMRGCVQKAKSFTRGAADYAIASVMYIGVTNVIDSLIVVKQFVFDEKLITMQDLILALTNNWKGYEDLRAIILKKGDFFGNDTERSNNVAQKLYADLYEFIKDKKNVFGYHFVIGDIQGYNEQNKFFGERTKATPDGRYDGENLKFGLGQSEGKDRNGLTAYLNSVAKIDPNGIGCGSTVTNVNLDKKFVTDNNYFYKTVDLVETYFKNGGTHLQLNYVSKEDLLKAKVSPQEYKNLRVRVTGYSDYFVRLKESIQDDVIARTEHK